MIPRLLALCALEMVAVVLLAMQVFAAPAALVAPPPPDAAAAPDAAAHAATGQVEAPQQQVAAQQAAPAAMREEAVTPWSPDDPVGILLTGAVRWTDGSAVDDASISAKLDGKQVYGDVNRGGFALVGMSPGTWSVILRGTGVKESTVEVELGDAAVQHHDFVLQRTFPIKVRIVTADGADDSTALNKATGYQFADLQVAAQAQPFPERFAPTDSGALFVGDSRYDKEMNPRDGFAGTLHLGETPPAHVALLQRHLVLTQQVVQPGQSEVTFVLDLDAILALAGSATVRVLDAETGLPIEGASVGLSTSNRMGGGAKTGADGRVTVEKLSPGYLRCRISAKDHEAWSRTVQIDVGEKLDLGDVRLGPAVKLEGTLVDADGKPVGGADITWAKLDQLGTVMPFATNMHARSEADGSFSISGLGRGLIAIAAASGSNGIQKIARGVFENPPTEPIVMRMVEPARCNFVWPKDPARTFDVMLFDAKRRPVTAVHLMHRSWQAAVTMPPGEYSYEVRDQNHALLKTGTLRLGAQAITLEIP